MNATLCKGQLHTVSLDAISSKSYVHRLLIAAALSNEEDIKIKSNIVSEDMKATCRCLEALGASIITEDGFFLVKKGISHVDKALLNCGESGSTARFLLPAALYFANEVTMTGKGKLPERPFGPLCDSLRAQGVSISSDYLPISASGIPQSGTYTLPGDVSSQFISGLLFMLPLLEEDSRIELTTHLESKGYVDMTIDVLSSFGITVIASDNGYTVPGGQVYHCPGQTVAEGDWSNGGFLLCMGALGQGISLKGLNPDSGQKDKEVVNILESFGAEVTVKGDEVTILPGKLRAVDIDVADIPDLVPALSMVAAYADGVSVFRNAGRLRIKESDRIEAVGRLLEGIRVKMDVEEKDGVTSLYIHGKGEDRIKDKEISFESFNDHRIVMAAAMAALREEALLTIIGSEAVNKSFPTFFEVCELMGISVTEE